MRTFLRLFFNLLMPISMIITIVSVAYFSVDYNFTKAMKLGVLSGVLLGLGISFIATLFLLITRRVGKPAQENVKIEVPQEIKHKTKESNQKTKEVLVEIQNSIEHKLMLLMDQKLAFEVALYAITDQKIGEITTQETKENSTIILHTPEETMQITSTPLTRHTAQIILKTDRNSQYDKKIISYIKEKEHSFLQY